MKFWEIKTPTYEDDYMAVRINGEIEHPYGLPGIKCSSCGEIWGGMRTVPYLCPPELLERKDFNERYPVDIEKFHELTKELSRYIGIQADYFYPGDILMPGFLNIPNLTQMDFLHCSIGTLIVSERIKDILVNVCQKDEINSFELQIGRIGKKDYSQEVVFPESGEPEDLINELTIECETCLLKYYEINISKNSKYCLVEKIISVCRKCGRTTYDPSSEMIMKESLWNGDNIFYLSPTLHIIITDDLKEKLEAIKPSNVVFGPL